MATETAPDGRETGHHTVFIDTSLDTHLATIVSDSDTVSDLKKKMLVEHPQCFPVIGEIKIHCLKVKRRGNFYHLSDSMLVKSAFGTTKRNWFISVDVSRSEQQDGIEHLDQRGAVDQLALPWVTDSRSVDRRDDININRPSDVSLIQVSQSMQPKIAPFVNLRVPTVDQSTSENASGEISKDMEEDRSSKDNDWITLKSNTKRKLDSGVQKTSDVANEEIKSKKRIRDVHHENSFESGFESQPATKKKRKTERFDGSVKALEDNKILTSDTDNVERKAATETHDEDKLKSENVILDGAITETLDDERFKITSVRGKKKKSRKRKDKHNSAHDQLAAVVPSNGEDNKEEILSAKNMEPSENMPDVDTVLEKDIQQQMPFGISEKEMCREVFREAVPRNQVPSSSMRPFNGEPDAGTVDGDNVASGVAPEGQVKGAKGSTKYDSAKEDKDAIDSSRQNLGFTAPEFESDQIDKHEEDRELPLDHGPEVKFHETSKEKMEHGIRSDSKSKKKKKAKKSAAKDKDESLMMHTVDPAGDISSVVPNSAFDDSTINGRKKGEGVLSNRERDESSERKRRDDSVVYARRKGDDLIFKEVEASQPTESNRNQMQAEDVSEKSSKEFKDTAGDWRKKKGIGRSTLRNGDGSAVKHADDADATKVKENILPCAGDEVEFSKPNEINSSQKNTENIRKSGNEDESIPIDGRKKRKKKTKDSAARKEESTGKQANVDVSGMPPTVPDLGLNDRSNDLKEDKSSLSYVHRKDNVRDYLADVCHASVAREGDIVCGNGAEFSLTSDTNKRGDDVDEKSKNKRGSTSKTLSDVPTEEQGRGMDQLEPNNFDKTQDSQSLDKGSVRKAKKNQKPSVRAPANKDQCTGLELELEKSKGIKHVTSLPEEISKDVVSSEVSKGRTQAKDDINNQVDIPKYLSHEIDFMHYFSPGERQNGVAPVDKVKETSRSERGKKPTKKRKELLVPPVGNPPDLQNSVASNTNQQDGEQYQSKNDGAIQSQDSLSKEPIMLSSKKITEVLTDGVKDRNLSNIDQIKTPKKIRKMAPRASKSSPADKGNNNPAESSSSSESSGRSFHNQVSSKRQLSRGQSHAAVEKTPSKNTARVENSSQRIKSSLNTPGAIFGDGSDESSAGDNGKVNSDAITRTPSDKSSSSESEGESNSSLDSRRNGSSVPKRKEGARKGIENSQKRLKNISMGDILRSSRIFKKAKVAATQEIEDTESQHIDIVPESQPR